MYYMNKEVLNILIENVKEPELAKMILKDAREMHYYHQTLLYEIKALCNQIKTIKEHLENMNCIDLMEFYIDIDDYIGGGYIDSKNAHNDALYEAQMRLEKLQKKKQDLSLALTLYFF